MYIITGKTNGLIWDTKNNCVLAKFKDGEFLTDNEATAKKLTSMGFDCAQVAVHEKEIQLKKV